MTNEQSEPPKAPFRGSLSPHTGLAVTKQKRVRRLRATSTIGLFILIALAAFGAVVLREAMPQGTSVRDSATVLKFSARVGVAGVVVAILVSIFMRPDWHEIVQVLASGFFVGVISEGLILNRERDSNVTAVAACACSLIMIAIAASTARWTLRPKTDDQALSDFRDD